MKADMAFIAATPCLIFWSVADYLPGPHRGTIANTAIAFAAFAWVLLGTQGSNSSRRLRSLNLEPELVSRLGKKHLIW